MERRARSDQSTPRKDKTVSCIDDAKHVIHVANHAVEYQRGHRRMPIHTASNHQACDPTSVSRALASSDNKQSKIKHLE